MYSFGSCNETLACATNVSRKLPGRVPTHNNDNTGVSDSGSNKRQKTEN